MKHRRENSLKTYRDSEISWLDKLCEDLKVSSWHTCEALSLYQTVRKILADENDKERNTTRTSIDEYLSSLASLVCTLSWHDEMYTPAAIESLNELTSMALMMELCFSPRLKNETIDQEFETVVSKLSHMLRLYLARTANATLYLMTAEKAFKDLIKGRTVVDNRVCLRVEYSPNEMIEIDANDAVINAVTFQESMLRQNDRDDDDDLERFIRAATMNTKPSRVVFASLAWHELLDHYNNKPKNGRILVCKKARTIAKDDGKLCVAIVYVDGDIPKEHHDIANDALVWLKESLNEEMGLHVRVCCVPFHEAPPQSSKTPVTLGRRVVVRKNNSIGFKHKAKKTKMDDDVEASGCYDKISKEVVNIINALMLSVILEDTELKQSTRSYVSLLSRHVSRSICKPSDSEDIPDYNGLIRDIYETKDETLFKEHPWSIISMNGGSLWKDMTFRFLFAKDRTKCVISDLPRYDFTRHYQLSDIMSRFQGGIFWNKDRYLLESLKQCPDVIPVYSCKDLSLASYSKEEIICATKNRELAWDSFRRCLSKVHTTNFYNNTKPQSFWKGLVFLLDMVVNRTRKDKTIELKPFLMQVLSTTEYNSMADEIYRFCTLMCPELKESLSDSTKMSIKAICRV